MNPNIAALLDLQVIDKQRQVLKQAREGLRARVQKAAEAAQAAQAAAVAAQAEVDRLQALLRQYASDSARCDATIADLRGKQMGAKTNKDYMAIINGIEQAKVEKSLREQSIKDLGSRLDGLNEKAAKANAQVAELGAALVKLQEDGGDGKPSPEEQAIQAQYDARKASCDPAFLEVYERLIKANHKMPLAKVDPHTRATPVGNLVSHNIIEQIRMGKLVVDRNTNSILYVVDKPGSAAKEGEA
jgi:predicted  nucleic acid-binding Zn-ribbon protein